MRYIKNWSFLNFSDIFLFCSEYERNIKYVVEPPLLALNHESREDTTTYFEFLAEHKK